MIASRISDADLDWLACRYVLNELSGPELDKFEQMLATDDRACNAVVEAVLLVEGVVQAERSPVEVPVIQPATRHASYRINAALVGSAAALVLTVGWLSFFKKPFDRPSGETATTVAALWIDGADAEEDQSIDRVLSVNREPLDLEDEDAVPGWLLAAVTEQHKTDDGEEMMQD